MQLPLTVFRSGYTIYVFQYFVEEAAGTVFFSRSVWTCRDCRHDADLQWDWPENSEHRIGRVKKKKKTGEKIPPIGLKKKKSPERGKQSWDVVNPLSFNTPGNWVRRATCICLVNGLETLLQFQYLAMNKSQSQTPSRLYLLPFKVKKKRALY